LNVYIHSLLPTTNMEEAKFLCMRCNVIGRVCNTCKHIESLIRERREKAVKSVQVVEPKKTARELIQEHREKSVCDAVPKKTARELIQEHRRNR
jgi:L-lactate utilization protein LutB